MKPTARILLDLPNWLGDVIHTLPALLALRDGAREGSVTVTAPRGYAPLFRGMGVAAVERPRRAGFLWARRHLRGRFDVAASARHSTRSKLLVAGTGAPVTLVSRGRGAAILGLGRFPVDRTRHQRHDLDGALVRLGVAPTDEAPVHLVLPAALRERGQQQRALLAGGGRVAILMPGSHADSGKRFPVEGYAALGRRLSSEGLRVVVVVGPGEEALGGAVATPAGATLAPTAWPIGEVAGFLAACDVAVGNDSGLTHLAAAVGCSTVALFGPTDPLRTAPVGNGLGLRRTGGMSHPWPNVGVVAETVRRLALGRAACAPERVEVTMIDGGGPLAQLAEQGTLNP